MDLLLVLTGYSMAWSIYLLAGKTIWRIPKLVRRSIEGGVFLGGITLLCKPFLPLLVFNPLMLLAISFIFYCVINLSLLKAVGASILLHLMTCCADYFVILPLIKNPVNFKFIMETSAGIALGTLIEAVIPGIIIIYCGVKKCLKTRIVF